MIGDDDSKELLWRLDSIKDMLMSKGVNDSRIYGCDEWSTPVLNINAIMDYIKNNTDNNVPERMG